MDPRHPERQKPQRFASLRLESGAAGRNRTHDPLVRSQVLYPAELQPLSHQQPKLPTASNYLDANFAVDESKNKAFIKREKP
jgi:hypothetical protein